MTLQCDGINNIGALIMLLTINGKSVYIIDGYFYYNIVDIFDTVGV